MKSIVITGSSSGIGKATAKYFAEQGWKVAATMRTPSKETELTEIENVSIYQLDVTDQASIDGAVSQIISDFGTVDVVLNNAGYGLAGPFEAASDEQIRHQFEVNVFGLMAVTKAFLPHFRANKAGMFLNVSSIGGRITFPFISLYHSTKWAVEGFTESISFEMSQIGVQVKIIEPGGVDTDFSGRSLVMAQDPDNMPEYNEAIGKFMAAFGSGSGGSSTAEYLAEEIFKATTDGSSQIRYLIGADAQANYGARVEAGDEAFIAGMNQRMFG